MTPTTVGKAAEVMTFRGTCLPVAFAVHADARCAAKAFCSAPYLLVPLLTRAGVESDGFPWRAAWWGQKEFRIKLHTTRQKQSVSAAP